MKPWHDGNVRRAIDSMLDASGVTTLAEAAVSPRQSHRSGSTAVMPSAYVTDSGLPCVSFTVPPRT
jgi:hypothetical protein